MLNYDAVVCVGPKHIRLARRAIRSLQRHTRAQRIYVVTSSAHFAAFARLQNEPMPIVLLDENTHLEGVTLNCLQDYLARRGAQPRRAGWYFQQFLKMSICFLPGVAEHYLIWDSDTILLKPLDFFDTDGTMFVKPSPGNHLPYFKLTQKLLGIGRLVSYSFIAEHLMVNREYMRQLIEKIANQCSRPSDWVWKIMDSIEDHDLPKSGFSEYETYGTFVQEHYPTSYRVRPVESWRKGASEFGVNPNRYDLHSLAKKYCYVTFERWNRGPARKVWQHKFKAIVEYYADYSRGRWIGSRKP